MSRAFQILALCLFLFNPDLKAQNPKESYVSSSVLSSGQWFRMSVTEEGIYKIDYVRLKQLGLVNPSNPKIFSNNFGQLSYYNNDPKPDDLKETPLFLETGSDGIFNEGDYLLFYAQGTHRWVFNRASGEYDFIRHNYSDTATYFLTSGSSTGKRIAIAVEPAGLHTDSSSVSDALFIHEQEVKNLIKSGREWYQPISQNVTVGINPEFTDIVTSEQIKYRLRVLDRASVPTMFRFYEGQILRQSIQVRAINLYNSTGIWAQIEEASGSLVPSSSSPVFEMKYFNNGEAGEHGWIDFVKLQARRINSFSGKTLIFSDSKVVSPGHITEFSVRTLNNNTIIWDVTDPFNPKRIVYTRKGENLKFKANTDSLRYFMAFLTEKALSPNIKATALPNQNLHGSAPADMIIITHPLFMEYATRLASIHQINSGLISLIVTPGNIYNEFSGGIPDIAAIRNFLRFRYLSQKGSTHPLKYLLLFGDGSFENKSLPPDNPNFIPTYQSQNSNVVVSSFTSDDFYGLLEDGEGEADGTEDIGIGRLPVSDTIQAGIIVSKISRYLAPSNKGNWKNLITIVADDEDGNTHMSDAEGLSALLRDTVPTYNVDKIYLDAFRQETSSTGQSYPDVNKAINDRINSGCLIFNYVGHGSEIQLASEMVVKAEDIKSWNNGARLPLFITATCEFSRFDDGDFNIVSREMTEKRSAGELVLLNSKGGGIALMSTTRVVFSAPNYFLNRNIYNNMFKRDESGNPLRLGDIIRLAKNSSGSGPNKRNFSLLGDPALRLAYPSSGKVLTDSVNHISIENDLDTLKALSMVTVSGHIEDNYKNLNDDFNGEVSLIVYDKESKIKTLANDGGQSMSFNLRNNILFSGKTRSSDGRFKFTFIVPRDIDYSFGKGKISYYASDNAIDMNGTLNDLIVGGFSNISYTDTTGPSIRLFLNDTLFRNGGLTDRSPRMLAIIQDNGGINTTGSGIGHDLIGYLDNNPNNTFVLNNYFENDFNNYKKGSINYNLSDLSDGTHSLTVKAWDNFNNSSEKSVLFMVKSGEVFLLKNLLNYPNPFFSHTWISVEHNKPDTEFEISVSIYNMNGQIVKIIKSFVTSSGYVIPRIQWDGNDDGGKRVGRGVYPYSVTVTSKDGETARLSGRMIIL
jgi:hypothetical protein